MAVRLRQFSGKVVRFWRQKADGFVKVDGSPREAHFHMSNFDDDTGGDEIRPGDRLSFYLEDAARGLRAIRISRI